MIVIYAEKPDMAEKIASSLGGASFKKADKKNGFYAIQIKGADYAVTWGYGHLCTLASAEGYKSEYKNWSKMPLPFIPDDYKIVLNERSGMPVKQTVKVVSGLFKKADYIINATDFDREGELIFFYLYQYLGCKKRVVRMKLSSTTKNGITEAFEHTVSEREVKRVQESARCRSIADWVVGCNLTATMTLKSARRDVVSIGRVQTPTLAMIVKRDEEIAGFKPQDYFTVDAIFTRENKETYKGSHIKKRFDSKNEAEQVHLKCNGKPGTVEKIDKTEKIRYVPGLYSLDILQMDANAKYGFSLKKTLDLTQELYEKGFVTYPRTDCQYLPEDMEDKIIDIADRLKNNGYKNLFTSTASTSHMKANKKRFFDDSKLGSHYAIIPTESIPANLSTNLRRVYELIAISVARMFYPNAKVQNTKVTTNVEGERFISSGTMILEKGWMEISPGQKDEILPTLLEQETVSAKTMLTAKKTEPPKHFTEKTLLSAMISAGKAIEDEELKEFMAKESIDGIGTVATRAGIIETLFWRKFIEKDGKNILSTSRGRELIHLIPIDDIKSASLTASYEKKLNQIVNGNQDPDKFLNEIYSQVALWCHEIEQISEERMKKMNDALDKGIGVNCPVCGSPVIEYDWGYGCSGYKEGCRFSVGTIAGKRLTQTQVKTLIEKGEVGPVSGFTSKAGKKFAASLKLEDNEEGGKKISFVFPERKDASDEHPDIYATCPKCHARIVKGPWGWVCENKCGVSVPYELCRRPIEPEMAEALFGAGVTPVLDGFISKKGSTFSAILKMDGDKITFEFPKRG